VISSVGTIATINDAFRNVNVTNPCTRYLCWRCPDGRSGNLHESLDLFLQELQYPSSERYFFSVDKTDRSYAIVRMADESYVDDIDGVRVVFSILDGNKKRVTHNMICEKIGYY
jgi:hypothetical protein